MWQMEQEAGQSSKQVTSPEEGKGQIENYLGGEMNRARGVLFFEPQ